MTYQVSVTGHGASADDAKEAFSNFIRACRQINAEGNGPMVTGSISGTDNEGNSFSLSADDVVELDAVDTSDDEQEGSSGEAPEDADSETEAGVEPNDIP